jgi:hypothetical protein
MGIILEMYLLMVNAPSETASGEGFSKIALCKGIGVSLLDNSNRS